MHERVHEIDAQIAALQAQRTQALAHADWLRARQAEQDRARPSAPPHASWPRVRRMSAP